MSLSVQYETLEEAEMRLNGTVVLYDGEPVYITRVAKAGPDDGKADVFRVYAQPLPYKPNGGLEDGAFRKFISSKKFDLSTFKMGFMNYKGEAIYCSRKPARQYKQGISNNTFVTKPLTGDKPFPYGAKAYRLTDLITDKSFVDMVKGVYPSFEKAREKVSKDGGSCAFSREYALMADADLDGLIYLYHKGDKVGFILDDKVKLANKMKCLKEALAELGLRL